MRIQKRFLPPFLIGIVTGAILLTLGLYAKGADKEGIRSALQSSNSSQSGFNSTSAKLPYVNHRAVQTSEVVEKYTQEKLSTTPQTTESNVSTASQHAGMNLQAIAMGDFTSVAGNWANSQGKVYTFNAAGVAMNGSAITQFSYTDYGTVEGNLSHVVGGVHIEFVPAGVSMSMTLADGETIEDVSDISRDRIWLGHSYTGIANEEDYLYRVD